MSKKIVKQEIIKKQHTGENHPRCAPKLDSMEITTLRSERLKLTHLKTYLFKAAAEEGN